MEIRHATAEDLPRMEEIYAHARAFMASQGNPNQWGPTNWPPTALLRQDIATKNSYVVVDGDTVVGAFFFRQGKDVDPCYRHIEGSWREDTPYGVVHRIAVDSSRHGVGSFALNWAFDQCHHLRIDTHGDNAVMQGLLKKLGFEYRGIIYVEEDDFPRLAFEK